MAQYTGTFSNLLEDSTQETSPKSSVDVEQSPQENTYQGTFSNLITTPSINTGEPSDLEKFKYGTAKELTLLGELWDLSKAFYNSYGDLTFEESRQKVKEERNKALLEKFTWAKGGQYENDAMVWGGRTAQMLLDPIYLLMPWARVAQSGKLIGKGGVALAGLGAGVGATDVSVRSFSNTGEVKLTDVALGAGLGGALSPVALGVQRGLGVAANKLFPNLFKSTKMKDAINDELRGNFKSKYGLNDDQLSNVYKISSIKSIQNLSSSVDNNYKLFVKPLQELETALMGVGKTFAKSTPFRPDQLTNIIKQMPGGLELKFKSLGNKTLSTIKTKKQFENVQKEITTEVNKLVDKQIKKSNRLNTNLQIKIVEELHKAGGLTAQVGRALTSALVRPAVGAGGGAVFATVADLDDEGFAKMVAGGAILGGVHRHLMRGGIKSIPLPKQIGFAKILKNEYWNNLGRGLRIITSGTQQSKLTARGPVHDELSSQMFYRPTDTIRTDWLGRIAKNQDESIGMIGTGNSVEERMERSMANWGRKIVDEVLSDADAQTQKLAISIVRGKKGVKDVKAKLLAKRIKNYLDEFRGYYKEVGFEEKELLKNYFPRKFDFSAINKNKASQDDFINRVAQAYVNIGKAKDLTEGKRLAGIYMSNLEGNYTKEIFDEQSLLNIWQGKKANAKLPISEHIEFERNLKGKYNQVEELLEPYLVNDVGTVLMDLARTSVKSVEFARTFGKDGSLLSSYLRRIAQQYDDNGFSLKGSYYEGGQHQADVDSIRHAVNSYFGRYGRRGTDTERSIGAILSTMANFNMMDKVTIANLGDLVQPFQNSRHLFSAIRGMWQSASSDMAIKENKIIRSAIRNAYVTPDGGSSPFLLEKGNANVMSFIGKSNEFFFKAIGLEAITGIARRYAYNVGAVDAHKSAQRLIQRLRTSKVKSLDELRDASSLRDIKHLHEVGAIKFNADRKILNADDVIAFGSAKNLNQAGKNESVRGLIQTVGNKAANRDAIIPTVGNRLLFTQTRNPLVRIIGQFSSWAMAKSAQTNAMISRVEDGNLKTGIAMLGALSVFGAVKNLRDFARTGEWEMDRELNKDPGRWLAFATQMSGNLGWLPTTINNSLLTTYGNTPVEFFPAVSIFNEFGTSLRDTSGAFLDKNSYDKALQSWLEFAPAPTVRAILDRAGVPFMVYKKDVNMLDAYKKSNIFKGTSLFSKGGLASETRQLFSTGELVKPKIKPQPKIKTEYQYDLKTEVEMDTVEDKKQLKELTDTGPKIVPKEKPDRFESSLAQSESSGQYDVVNKQGYMGKYQFGEARLTDYRDATGEDFDKETFLNDKELQEKVFKWHTDDYKKRIVDDGLDKFIGTKINGVTVTLNGLLAVAHLGGYEGMTKFLETQGQYNPDDNPDGEGTTLFDYLKRFNFHSGGMAHTHGSSFKLKGKGPSRSQQRIKTKSSNTGSTNRERYIASTKGGTTKPPKTIVKSSDGGGDTGGNDNNNKGIQVTTNIPIPIIDDKETIIEKVKDVKEKDGLFIGAKKEGEVFGGSYEIGTEGYLGLESAQALNIDKGIRGTAQWTKGDTSFKGEYEDSDWSLMGQKNLDSGWNVQAGVTNTDNDYKVGFTIGKKWKSGGLLDRKRLK